MQLDKYQYINNFIVTQIILLLLFLVLYTSTPKQWLLAFSFHHLMTTQHLRTMHQHLHSTALEMEHFFCGQWMDTLLAHHTYSIEEYDTHPSLYHQMDLLCPLSSLFQPPKLTTTLQSSV